MPAIQSCFIAPIWAQFSALLPLHDDHHTLGCHRRRIADRVIFDKLLSVLVFGCAYWRIADASCSATTIPRRRDEWMQLGIMVEFEELVRHAYDRMIGLDLTDLAVDGCITEAPCGGEVAGRSPVDRGKQGTKRSIVVDGAGIPLGVLAAPANVNDSPLLEPTVDLVIETIEPGTATVHLDRGYDSKKTRHTLTVRALEGAMARRE
jgi:transposase